MDVNIWGNPIKSMPSSRESIMCLKRSIVKCLANRYLMTQSEVIVRSHNMARYPIPLSCMSIQETSSTIRAPQDHGEMTETPLIRTILSGLGIYLFANLVFLSRKNTSRFGMNTLDCPVALVVFCSSGKSIISPTA